MKLTVPNDTHRATVLSYMASSFASRRAWTKSEGPTVTKILEEYPRLTDFDGAVVSSASILTRYFFSVTRAWKFMLDLKISVGYTSKIYKKKMEKKEKQEEKKET